jgi:hypothetical protein
MVGAMTTVGAVLLTDRGVDLLFGAGLSWRLGG